MVGPRFPASSVSGLSYTGFRICQVFSNVHSLASGLMTSFAGQVRSWVGDVYQHYQAEPAATPNNTSTSKAR